MLSILFSTRASKKDSEPKKGASKLLIASMVALVIGCAGALQLVEDYMNMTEEHFVMMAFVAVAYVALERQGTALRVAKKKIALKTDRWESEGSSSEEEKEDEQATHSPQWKSRADLDMEWRRTAVMNSDNEQPLSEHEGDRYSNRIVSACRVGDMGQARRVLEEMMNDGVNPDIFTFNSIVHGYAKTGELALAEEWYRRATEEAGLTPDVFSFAPLVRCCFRRDANGVAKAPEKGELWLARMRAAGVPGDMGLQNMVMDYRGRNGELAKVDAQLYEMLDDGPEPDTQTFNIAIRAHQKGSNFAKVESWFKRMKLQKVPTDFHTYRNLILACAQSPGKVERAEEFLNSMAEDMVAPHPACYAAMLQVYGEARKFEKLFSFFEHMKQRGLTPTVATYNALVKPFSVNGDLDGLEKVLQMMREDGLNPLLEPSILQGWVGAYIKKPTAEANKTLGLVQLAVAEGAVIDQATLAMLERAIGSKLTADLVQKLALRGHGWAPKPNMVWKENPVKKLYTPQASRPGGLKRYPGY